MILDLDTASVSLLRNTCPRRSVESTSMPQHRMKCFSPPENGPNISGERSRSSRSCSLPSLSSSPPPWLRLCLCGWQEISKLQPLTWSPRFMQSRLPAPRPLLLTHSTSTDRHLHKLFQRKKVLPRLIYWRSDTEQWSLAVGSLEISWK